MRCPGAGDLGEDLYDENLFRAIIATEATGCEDQLQMYTSGHHVDLRRWAAVVLGHWGHKTDPALLEPLLDRSVAGPGKPNAQEALSALRAAGRH